MFLMGSEREVDHKETSSDHVILLKPVTVQTK